jgi:predicted MFS family arabinose efflux permease
MRRVVVPTKEIDLEQHIRASAMIGVLRQRNVALLWLAGLVSLFGDWAFYTIMPIFVLDATGSVFLAGMVWAVIALPSVVVGPVAGVYVDRWDRRRIMFWGNLAQAAAAAALLLAASASPGIWVAMTVLLLNASLAAVILPVGAVMYTWLGIEGVAVVNAATFLAAALLVRGMRLQHRRLRSRTSEPPIGVGSLGFWPSLRDGARIVWRHRVLATIFLILGVVAFADGPLSAMIAPFIDTSLGEGATGVGVFATVRGVAGILGGGVIGLIGHRVRETRLLTMSAGLNGLGFAAMAILQDFRVACLILLVVIGPTHIGLHTTLMTLLQRGSEDASRGRVFALSGALTGTLFLIGTVVGSAAGDAASPPAVIIGSGLLFLVAAFLAGRRLPEVLATVQRGAISGPANRERQ